MEVREIKEILLKNRPDRPRLTESRRFQKAIDEIIPILDEMIAEEDDIIAMENYCNSKNASCFGCKWRNDCINGSRK